MTVRRERVKDAVNTVWWLSLDPHPKASNRGVLKPYSEAQVKLMEQGYKPKKRPSEHDISDKFDRDNNGTIPPNIIADQLEIIGKSVQVPVNVVSASNTSSNDQYLRLCRENRVQPHPARFPRALPEFAMGLCTDVGDVVLDPFAGSNMTGFVAEALGRRWVALEQNEEYLRGSTFRFTQDNSYTEEPTTAVQATLFELPPVARRAQLKEEDVDYQTEK